MSSTWVILTPLVGRSWTMGCSPTFHRHLGGYILHNILTRAKESNVPCSMVPIWHIMKAHDPPQPPLPLNDPNSEAYTTSIIHRKSALCEGQSTMHRTAEYIQVLTFILLPMIQRKIFLAFSLFRVATQFGVAIKQICDFKGFLIKRLPLQEEIQSQTHISRISIQVRSAAP